VIVQLIVLFRSTFRIKALQLRAEGLSP